MLQTTLVLSINSVVLKSDTTPDLRSSYAQECQPRKESIGKTKAESCRQNSQSSRANYYSNLKLLLANDYEPN